MKTALTFPASGLSAPTFDHWPYAFPVSLTSHVCAPLFRREPGISQRRPDAGKPNLARVGQRQRVGGHLAAGMGVSWREPCGSHSARKTSLYASSHLTLQEVRNVGADKETQVHGNLIWLIQVYKEFTAEF